MPSTIHTDVLDSALSVLSGNSDLIVALTSDPTSYAIATGAAQLSSAALTASDFTLQSSANGRQLAIAAKSSTASVSGTASYVALLDTSTSRVLFSADIPSASLTSGDVVQFLAWSIALAPAA
ncbi:MAG: hypothetical protein AAF862_14025 [Pseudomonadota bacterium]